MDGWTYIEICYVMTIKCVWVWPYNYTILHIYIAYMNVDFVTVVGRYNQIYNYSSNMNSHQLEPHPTVRHEVEQPEAPTPWRPRVIEFTFKEHVTSGASMYFLHISWYFSDIFWNISISWCLYNVFIKYLVTSHHFYITFDGPSHRRATLRNEAFIEFSGSPGAALQRFQRQIRWRRWGAERCWKEQSSLETRATIWVHGNGRNGTCMGSSKGSRTNMSVIM